MAFASNILFSIDTALQQRGLVNVETISTVKRLELEDSTIQILNNSSGGDVDLYLPPEKDGIIVWVRSMGSDDIAVRDAVTTYCTLAANKCCLMACSGSTAGDWQLVFEQA